MNSLLGTKGLLVLAVAHLLGCAEGFEEGTYHPQLEVMFVQSEEKHEVLVVTGKAIEAETIRVVNDACTLSVMFARSPAQDSSTMTVVVQNIAPDSDGGFHGVWTIPDSLLVLDSIRIGGCISDVEGERSCVEEVLSLDND